MSIAKWIYHNITACTGFCFSPFGLCNGILTSSLLSLPRNDAFLYRALPCTLYDCVVGLVLYPIIARLLASGAQDRGPRTPRLR